MSGPTVREQPLEFTPYMYKTGKTIKLPGVEVSQEAVDFLTVLKERRSVKQLGKCTLEKLSQILYYGVKPYCIGKDDYGMTVYRSAAPSAGGRHPIDILVGLKEWDGRHLYLYLPLNHSLRRLDVEIELAAAFFDDVEHTLPMGVSVLLWFSVQYMRTASKYTDFMSLVWRDLGAQLCCLQQVAKYVGTDSCPIGYLAEDTFNALFQTELLVSGGGMIIGDKKK